MLQKNILENEEGLKEKDEVSDFNNHIAVFNNLRYVQQQILIRQHSHKVNSSKISDSTPISQFSDVQTDPAALSKEIEHFFSSNCGYNRHTLKESPCQLIIEENGLFFKCIFHPDIRLFNLEVAERHCKDDEPEIHKAKLLELANVNKLGGGE